MNEYNTILFIYTVIMRIEKGSVLLNVNKCINHYFNCATRRLRTKNLRCLFILEKRIKNNLMYFHAKNH